MKYRLFFGYSKRAPWASFFTYGFYRDRWNNDPGWTLLIQAGELTLNITRRSCYSLGSTFWPSFYWKEWKDRALGLKKVSW